MDKKKYISYNSRINQKLKYYGFKRKNKGFYRLTCSDIIQHFLFGHSTQGRKFAKYYDITACIEIPKVFKIAQELDIYTGWAFYCSNIGELMPQPPVYLEWLITEDSDEKYDDEVVDSMLYHIEKYAIPFLDKYCTPQAIVEGIKKCAYPGRYGGDNLMVCIILLLYGTKEDFLWFVEKRSHELQYKIYDNSEVHWDYRHPTEPLTESCKFFLENVEKLKPLMEEKGITW